MNFLLETNAARLALGRALIRISYAFKPAFPSFVAGLLCIDSCRNSPTACRGGGQVADCRIIETLAHYSHGNSLADDRP
jgi:hypothetical protein